MLKDVLDHLQKIPEKYQGDGYNHDGSHIACSMKFTPICKGLGFAISFRAIGKKNRKIYHEEFSTLAFDEHDNLCLWILSNNLQRFLRHELVSCESNDDLPFSLRFCHNQIADQNQYRETIIMNFWKNLEISYHYAWGMPSEAFTERSSVTLSPIDSR